MSDDPIFRKHWPPRTTYTFQWAVKDKSGALETRADVQSIAYKVWDVTDAKTLTKEGTLLPANVWYDTPNSAGSNLIWEVPGDFLAKGGRIYRIEVLVNHNTDLQALLIEEVTTAGGLTEAP